MLLIFKSEAVTIFPSLKKQNKTDYPMKTGFKKPVIVQFSSHCVHLYIGR